MAREYLQNMEFGVSSPDIFQILLDSSGSMDYYEEKVRQGLRHYQEKLGAMDERSAVLVSKSLFSDNVQLGKYLPIEELDTRYVARGGTELYKAICEAAKSLFNRSDGAIDMLQDMGYTPKGTLVVFSDGLDNNTDDSDRTKGLIEKCRKAVDQLNENGIVTAFVCFGNASPEVAKKLGFRNITTEFDVVEIFETISTSCVRQSQSSVSLTDGFFDNN